MRHILAILLIGFCLLTVNAEEPAVVSETKVTTEQVAEVDLTSVDQMIEELNPAQDNDIRDTNMLWGEPASSIGKEIQWNTWLAVLIFLPFLIVPQILLVYVIVKFRDQKDGRKSATFVGHHKLEFWWTVIPIIVLVIVTFPMVKLLYKQEMPPKGTYNNEAMEVHVFGKTFDWVYNYPKHGIEGLNTFTLDFTPEIEGVKTAFSRILQEPAVFEVNKVTNLYFKSNDVTHAWGVPALAVKKDCFYDRITHSWFDSDRTGWFEGQCYELCGARHGYMIVTVAVVQPEQFQRWVDFMHHRDAATEVVTALRSGDAALAVKEYLKDDASDLRKDAVRYWLKYEYMAKIEYLKNNKQFIKGETWIDGAMSKTKAFLDAKESELNRLMRPYKSQAKSEETTVKPVTEEAGA